LLRRALMPARRRIASSVDRRRAGIVLISQAGLVGRSQADHGRKHETGDRTRSEPDDRKSITEARESMAAWGIGERRLPLIRQRSRATLKLNLKSNLLRLPRIRLYSEAGHPPDLERSIPRAVSVRVGSRNPLRQLNRTRIFPDRVTPCGRKMLRED
jgi:hypothetical protein